MWSWLPRILLCKRCGIGAGCDRAVPAGQSGKPGIANPGLEPAKPNPYDHPGPRYIHQRSARLARLETIQYSIEKVITGETGGGTFQALFGDKILFVGHGTVIAGIDMEKLQPEDMRFENGVLDRETAPG